MTFFATNPIPAANLGKVAESVNFFTNLLSEILFWQTKRINPLTLLLQEAFKGRASKRRSVFVCFAVFQFAMLAPVVLVY